MDFQIEYILIFLIGVFLSSVSQVLLKKEAQKSHTSTIKEYLNPLVITAYTIFFITTFLCIFSYRGIPLSFGPILEASSYIFICIFGYTIFKEKVNKYKLIGLLFILGGIIIYTLVG